MNTKNEVFEYLIGQLRQQVNDNRCEDLAHEVQSLKNQLRDALQLVDELQEDNIKKSEHTSHLTGQVKELHLALDCAENEVMCLRSIVDLDPKGAIGYIRRANSAMTDTMCRQYLSKALEELGCKDVPEQSGRRKEDAQECSHNWRFVNGKAPAVCVNCGVTKSSECEHDWQFYGVGFPCMCIKCGLKSPDRQKEDTQECEHDWVLDEKGDYFVCAKCGEQEAELVDCQHINTVGLRKGFAPGFTKKCLDCGAKLK